MIYETFSIHIQQVKVLMKVSYRIFFLLLSELRLQRQRSLG